MKSNEYELFLNLEADIRRATKLRLVDLNDGMGVDLQKADKNGNWCLVYNLGHRNHNMCPQWENCEFL